MKPKFLLTSAVSAVILTHSLFASSVCVTFADDNNIIGKSLYNENQLTTAEETDGITVYSLYPTKDSVDDFYAMIDNSNTNGVEIGDRALLNDEKNCYWLRTIPENPDDTSIEDLWMFLYKNSITGAAHLAIDEKVVRFIGNEGGLGVTSLALGDLNNDGWNEIYFTYSWNPYTYCSQVGYFDTKTADVHYFGDYAYPDGELIFTSENDTLTVCKAELTNYEDKVHFELKADKSIAEIVCNDGEIEIESLSDDFVKLEEKLEPPEKLPPIWLPKNADEAETFMNENGEIFIKDGYICCIKCIYSVSAFRGDRICLSEKSDVKAPISYKIYENEYWDDYIVACFEMPPDSYIEICHDGYHFNTLGIYISDENGDINEGFKGDVNKDSNINIADLVVLQKWLVGNGDSLDCWQLADICDDNQLDVFDMVMLRKLLIEKE